MIPGPEVLKVKRFLYIDRCCEGYNFAEPSEGEEFMGIPPGYYGEGSMSIIEVFKGPVLIRTINCADLAVVEFVEPEGVNT